MSTAPSHWLRLDPDYAATLASVRPLGPDEERDLARRARRGDPSARARMVEGSLRFVAGEVRRYRRPGVDLMDLVAEGNAALLRAVDRFDPDRGVRFVVYARWWIRDGVTRFLAGQAGAVAVPKKALARLRRQPGGTDPDGGLARAAGPALPLEAREAEPGGRPGRDRLPPSEDPIARVLEILDRQRRHQDLTRALAGLPPRERAAVMLHHGLGREAGLDFRSMARILGLSRETSRCLYHRGLARLGRVLGAPARP